MYKEEEYLQLSGIQHYAFCRRQWALIHIERQWEENLHTVEGGLLHQKAHDKYALEKRGGVILSRGMSVYSAAMGVSGECDVVEFKQDPAGITLAGRDGTYTVCPVEYKKGVQKEGNMDMLQLAAQAMCLEEMLCCEIPTGCLYYGERKHRVSVELDAALRDQVKSLFLEMHDLFRRRHTPKGKRTKACNACSLKELCLPFLNKSGSAARYIEHAIHSDEKDDSPAH